MFQTDQTLQPQLFAFTPRDLIAEDSDVWLYCDLFDSLDLLDFDGSYSYQGQHAKEPKLMLRTLFYALTHGVVSGRRLQEVCRHDNRYIVLSGDLRPDRRTFDRFIKRHAQSIDKLFVQLVHLAQKMGLVELGRVAIDGSKFKAYAGKSMRYDKMEKALNHINENLKILKQDLAESNSSNNTEQSCRLNGEIQNQQRRRALIQAAKEKIEQENAALKVKDSKKRSRLAKSHKTIHDLAALTVGSSAKFPFGYNVQAAVDQKAQIIVAADLHDNSCDQRALPKMLDQVYENCQQVPDKTLGDCGYNSLENLQETDKRGSEPVIPISGEYGETPIHSYEQISKGEGDRTYHCLSGKTLPLACRGSDGYLTFKKSKDFCIDCPFANECKHSDKKVFQILDDDKRAYMLQHAQKCRSEEFKEDYRHRKAIVEPVFGNIKNKGIKIFVRGHAAVSTWWKIACIAHNIEKIIHQGLKTSNQDLLQDLKTKIWQIVRTLFISTNTRILNQNA